MADQISEETGTPFETDESRMAWLESLPEPVREWQEANQATSPDAFWGQMGNLRSAIGRSITIPTDEASDDMRREFYEKVVSKSNGKLAVVPGDDDEVALAAYRKTQGVPEDPDGYEMPQLDNAPTGFVPDGRAKAIREAAHRHGLPAKQFAGLAKDILEMDLEGHRAAERANQEAQAMLRNEWGDAYDQRYERVAAFLERDGAPEALLNLALGKQLGPDTAKYFYSVVERMGGEGAEIARQIGGATIEARDEAMQKIDEIYQQDGRDGRPMHPFFDASHPNHERALKQMLTLQGRATGADRSRPGGAELPAELLGN